MRPESAYRFYEDDPVLVERVNSPVSLRRMGTTTDIFNTVNFLAKPESSSTVGQTIEIAGGAGNLDWHQLIADK